MDVIEISKVIDPVGFIWTRRDGENHEVTGGSTQVYASSRSTAVSNILTTQLPPYRLRALPDLDRQVRLVILDGTRAVARLSELDGTPLHDYDLEATRDSA